MDFGILEYEKGELFTVRGIREQQKKKITSTNIPFLTRISQRQINNNIKTIIHTS